MHAPANRIQRRGAVAVDCGGEVAGADSSDRNATYAVPKTRGRWWLRLAARGDDWPGSSFEPMIFRQISQYTATGNYDVASRSDRYEMIRRYFDMLIGAATTTQRQDEAVCLLVHARVENGASCARQSTKQRQRRRLWMQWSGSLPSGGGERRGARRTEPRSQLWLGVGSAVSSITIRTKETNGVGDRAANCAYSLDVRAKLCSASRKLRFAPSMSPRRAGIDVAGGDCSGECVDD